MSKKHIIMIVVWTILVILATTTIVGRSVRKEVAKTIQSETLQSIVAVAAEPEPEPKPDPDIGDLRNDPAFYIAKTVYGEARGCSKVEQAAVIWCILNRVDSGYSKTGNPSTDIIRVVTQPYQFVGYRAGNPVTDDIYNLTIDVLTRWVREKNGETEVGRVLPKEYLYFHGDGVRNHFRNAYRGGNRWDWRLENPYDDNL